MKTISLVLILLSVVAGILFYRDYKYRWMPRQIRERCLKETAELVQALKSASIFDFSFKSCLKKYGIKE